MIEEQKTLKWYQKIWKCISKCIKNSNFKEEFCLVFKIILYCILGSTILYLLTRMMSEFKIIQDISSWIWNNILNIIRIIVLIFIIYFIYIIYCIYRCGKTEYNLNEINCKLEKQVLDVTIENCGKISYNRDNIKLNTNNLNYLKSVKLREVENFDFYTPLALVISILSLIVSMSQEIFKMIKNFDGLYCFICFICFIFFCILIFVVLLSYRVYKNTKIYKLVNKIDYLILSLEDELDKKNDCKNIIINNIATRQGK